MAEFASDDDLLIHLYVLLCLECEYCRLWEPFVNCWEGIDAGEKGAWKYANRAAAQAKDAGWLLLMAGRAICPRCQKFNQAPATPRDLGSG